MRVIVGAVLCTAALVAGCSTVDGDAQAVDPAAHEPAFDPCSDIPDDAIRAVGMDPASEGRDILGVHQPGWKLCSWNDDSVAVSVYSAGRALDEIRSNPDFLDFADTVVDGAAGLVFRRSAEPASVRCYVAFGGNDQLVMVAVTVGGVEDGEPCERAHEAASTFRPFATN